MVLQVCVSMAPLSAMAFEYSTLDLCRASGGEVFEALLDELQKQVSMKCCSKAIAPSHSNLFSIKHRIATVKVS